MTHPVEVEIMGHRLTVVSDEGAEHVRQVAGYVDRRMRQVAGSPAAVSLQIALVTALNIASEYWKLQHQQEELGKTINRLAQRVSASLSR